MVLPLDGLPMFPVAVSLAETTILLVGGWFLFSRLEVKMADEI